MVKTWIVKYFHNKCSYKDYTKTCKKLKSKELKFAFWQKKKAKPKLPGYLWKILIYDDFSKKCHVIFKKFFFESF